MEALLPGALKLDDVSRVHIRRHPLQYGESKVGRITLAKLRVSTVAASGVILPTEQIVLAVRRSDVPLPIRNVKDVVDSTPL
jgi:hypothetical protein